MNWLEWFYLSLLFDRRSKWAEAVNFLIALVLTVGAFVTLYFDLSSWFGRTTAYCALGGIFIVLTIALVLALVDQRRRDRRWHWDGSDPCVRCGYDLRANQTIRCPECGTPCVAHSRQAWQKPISDGVPHVPDAVRCSSTGLRPRDTPPRSGSSSD